MKRDQEGPRAAEEKAGGRSGRGKSGDSPSSAPSRQLVGLQRSAGNRAVAARLGGDSLPIQRVGEPLVVQRNIDEELRKRLPGVSEEDIIETFILMFKNSGLNTTAAMYAGSEGGSSQLKTQGSKALSSDKSAKKLLGSGVDAAALTDAQLDQQIQQLERQIETARTGGSGKADRLKRLQKQLANVNKRNDLRRRIDKEMTPEEREEKALATEEAELTAKETAEARRKEIAELERKLKGGAPETREELEEKKLAKLKERLKERQTEADSKEKRTKEIGELENLDEGDLEDQTYLEFLRNKKKQKQEMMAFELQDQDEASLEEQARLEFLKSKRKQKQDAMAFNLQSQDISQGIVDVMQNPALRAQAMKNNPMLAKWAKLKKKPGR